MRTVCFVSDRTGITTEILGHSLLSQFATMQFRTITMPFVATVEEARGVVARIDAIAQEERERLIEEQKAKLDAMVSKGGVTLETRQAIRELFGVG